VDFIPNVDAEHSAENGWELRVTGSQRDSAWSFIYSIRLIQSQADCNLFECRICHGEMQLRKQRHLRENIDLLLGRSFTSGGQERKVGKIRLRPPGCLLSVLARTPKEALVTLSLALAVPRWPTVRVFFL
jgi:hypothetical protein